MRLSGGQEGGHGGGDAGNDGVCFCCVLNKNHGTSKGNRVIGTAERAQFPEEKAQVSLTWAYSAYQAVNEVQDHNVGHLIIGEQERKLKLVSQCSFLLSRNRFSRCGGAPTLAEHHDDEVMNKTL